MAEQQVRTPKYWWFREDRDSNMVEDAYYNVGHRSTGGFWIFRGEHPEIEAGDVIYVSHREDPDDLVDSWGSVDVSEGFIHDPVTNVGTWSNTRVYVTYMVPAEAVIIKVSDVADDTLMAPLLSTEYEVGQPLQLSPDQAAAFNRLIRERGGEAPPDPEPEGAAGEEASEGGERAEKGARPKQNLTINQALQSFAYKSVSVEGIFVYAGDIALARPRSGYAVTTSTLLFAIARAGISLDKDSGAAPFLFRWLNEHLSQGFETTFQQFMEEGKRSGSQSEFPEAVPTRVDVRLSARATRIVGRASELSHLTGQQGVVSGRHLLGALILESQTGESGAARRLAALGADLQTLRKDFLAFIDHPSTKKEEIEKWRELLIEAAPPAEEAAPESPEPDKPYLPTINADSASGADLLNIKKEVDGFANIIAASDVRPPLSIGLFGDWGSGKSFFMSKLKERVTEITRKVRARGEGEGTAYLANVVQIDFNAWHYVEANLWASIVSHVFENLSLSEEEDKEKAEERKRLLLAKLDTTLQARREAAAVVQAKEQELAQAETALEQVKREQADADVGLRDLIVKGVWGIAREALSGNAQAQDAIREARAVLGQAGLPASLKEFKQEVAATQTALGRAQLYASSIAKTPRFWLKVALLLAAALLIPLGLIWLLEWKQLGDVWGRFVGSVMPLLTLVGGVYTWLLTKRGQVSAALDKLSAAKGQLDALYEDARAEYEGQKAALQQELAAKRGEVREAREKLGAAKKEVRETVSALREMEPGVMLERFVRERAASDDYRKLLGVVALIRRDFKQLSDLLGRQGDGELRKAVEEKLRQDAEKARDAQQAEGAAADPDPEAVDEKLKEYRIDRIVLYIDDLDRCPPRQVVDVLQAIHLLLAFELFVVVVGVDERWVRHSLKSHLPGLLGVEGAATPHDYIEKIFQVPFWLKPMGSGGSADLLRGLIPEPEPRRPKAGVPAREAQAQPAAGGGNGQGAAVEPAAVAAQGLQGAAAAASSANIAEARPAPETKAGAAAAATAGDVRGQARANGKGDEFILKPDGLKLYDEEREAMIRLSKVIGRTPRTLKRFVNIYRIIKAGLKGRRLAAFIGRGAEDGEYRAVLILLSVAHGEPDIAPFFFRELRGRCRDILAGQEDQGFKAFLGDMKQPDFEVPAYWYEVIKELEGFAKSFGDIPLEALGRWAPAVVRYTFKLGRLSEDLEVQGGVVTPPPPGK